MEVRMEWRDRYAAAMLELDREHLGARIDEAEAAIQKAFGQQSKALSGRKPTDELQCLRDALHNLRTLRRVELNKPERIVGQVSFQLNEATL
jgi:hypothetical protein